MTRSMCSPIEFLKSSNNVNNQRNRLAKGVKTCDQMEILSRALARGARSKSTTTNNYRHHNHCRHHLLTWPMSARAKSILSLLICATLALIFVTNSTQATQNTTQPTGTNVSLLASPVRRAKSVSGPESKTNGVKSSPIQSFEQQQSSELSSTYVQIPIAEPIDTLANGNSDLQQQQAVEDGGDSSADSTKATTWTGPYPKKFHIGYIKQSDLHQVLMESLKNDPFLGSKKSSSSSSSLPPPATSVASHSGGKTSAASGGASSLPSSSQPPTGPSSGSSSTKGSSHQTESAQEPAQLDDSLANPVAPQQQLAPPSDASSLMQSNPYPKLGAVQQVVAANKNHHLNHHPNHSGQQQFLHQQQAHRQARQQAHQFQWPASNSHGRLVSPQVQPRPSALNYLGKSNMYQANNMLMLLQPQQQQHPHHAHQQHRALGHQGNFRNAPVSLRHSNRQPVGGYQPFSNNHMGQQQSFKFNAAPMVQQMPAAFQQAPQFQLAGSPQSFTNQPVYTVNNFPVSQQQQQQPIQQQQQQSALDGDQMELIQLTNGPANVRQKTKSDYYLSSWRPVQSAASSGSGEEVPKQQQQQQQQLTTSEIAADGFDEDFGAPATGGNGNSMNRHPVLSNFLQNGGNAAADTSELNGKTSPAAKKVKQQTKTVATSNTGGATKGPSKGFDADSVQQRQESAAGTKSDTSRRAAAGNSSSTTTQSSVETNSTTSSTAAPGGSMTTTTTSGPSESTTMSSVEQTSTPLAATTTTSGQMNVTMAQGALETTTEPDSEVFESDSTEPSTDDEATTTTSAPTTTSSSMMQASNGRSSTPTPSLKSPSSSTTPTTVQQQQGSEASGGELEVATQSGQQTGNQFPGLTQSVDEQQTMTSTTPNSVQQQSTASSREETTPRPMNEVEGSLSMSNAQSGSTQSSMDSSTDSSSAAASTTKTDATMSDEALMAAAVRASELTKSSRTSSSTTSVKRPTKLVSQSQGGTKKARSSERILQQASAGAVEASKGSKPQQQQKQASKLITRKPNAGQRASKQISGVKGAGAGPTSKGARNGTTKSAAQKAAKKKSASGKLQLGTDKVTTSAKSNKFTRMVPASANQSANSSQPTQMVSMTAAQAQSAAQTLASLLLSRCLSSNNCAHLLDVCSTKQAAVPFGATTSSNLTTSELSNSSVSSSAWSMPVGLMSSNLMSLMQALQADKALQLFPAWRETIENIMDQEAPAGYTLIMPSNEAIDRMALSQVDSLLANGEQMSQLIDNHILDSALTIELAPSRQSTTNLATQRARHQTRYIKSKGLQINQHRDRMVTINGKRVVYANQPASGGRIHVIDGLLDWPGQALNHATASRAAELTTTNSNSNNNNNNRLLDIMDTLRQCDKFDGFVTLAEGTGLTQILKQDEPLTVFVPSNEALRKIPDEELEVIKNNSTALREFIMYHIVNGSYFSQDLRDGQQLASILDMRPIQVGVRVDGCSRRLVEANTSPMRRPDIVAKNGVIHILDWYLTTRDNEWCDPIGRLATTGAAGSSTSNQQDSVASSGSERVQQLASEQVAASVIVSNQPPQSGTSVGYATRMTSLPANHKPAIVANDMEVAASLMQPSKSSDEQQTVASSSPSSSVIIEHVQ